MCVCVRVRVVIWMRVYVRVFSFEFLVLEWFRLRDFIGRRKETSKLSGLRWGPRRMQSEPPHGCYFAITEARDWSTTDQMV